MAYDASGDGSCLHARGETPERTRDPDRLGTATRQTGSTASVTATRSYATFGMALSTTGTPKDPFGFAGGHGYQEDPDSGLKLLGHRYYDSSTGRFLTRDPVQDGWNWYAYCENDPLRAVDPDGRMPEWIGNAWDKLKQIPGRIKDWVDDVTPGVV